MFVPGLTDDFKAHQLPRPVSTDVFLCFSLPIMLRMIFLPSFSLSIYPSFTKDLLWTTLSPPRETSWDLAIPWHGQQPQLDVRPEAPITCGKGGTHNPWEGPVLIRDPYFMVKIILIPMYISVGSMYNPLTQTNRHEMITEVWDLEVWASCCATGLAAASTTWRWEVSKVTTTVGGQNPFHHHLQHLKGWSIHGTFT